MSSGEKKIIFFSSRDCDSCKEGKKAIRKIIKKYPEINVEYVDVDKYPEKADQLQIESTPSLRFYLNDIYFLGLDINGFNKKLFEENIKELNKTSF